MSLLQVIAREFFDILQQPGELLSAKLQPLTQLCVWGDWLFHLNVDTAICETFGLRHNANFEASFDVQAGRREGLPGAGTGELDFQAEISSAMPARNFCS